jgi:type II restriction/modification system DNA methylase subunit YeeA
MLGLDNGSEVERELDGVSVVEIHSDLTAATDLTKAAQLQENATLAFMGDTKVGPFDIPEALASKMLAATGNPNGRPNTDVVRPWANGREITGVAQKLWIIDFPPTATEEDAAQYEMPFQYIAEHVKPFRKSARSGDRTGVRWWIHQRPRPDMRVALAPLRRYVATPRVAKHRLFTWMGVQTLADCQLIVFAREDDYFFGTLHSKLHELWALRQGTQLEDRPRYTPTTCFETFPFPWPPGKEPVDDPRVFAIAAAAKDLVEKRDRWLNPEGATEPELKKRTLTNLYNQRPTWLDLAHKKLDQAVLDAYAWPHDLTDDQILERLLALNLERAGAKGSTSTGKGSESG